jgi:hypothetical protein
MEVFQRAELDQLRQPDHYLQFGSFGAINNTRNRSGAPGLGCGEPRKVRLTLKLLLVKMLALHGRAGSPQRILNAPYDYTRMKNPHSRFAPSIRINY